MERPDPLAPPEGYGERVPVHLLPSRPPREGLELDRWSYTLPGQARPDTLCAADRRDPASPPVCTAEFEFTWVLGDVAEHIMSVELCGSHSGKLAGQFALGARARCTVCGNWAKVIQVTDRATGQDAGYAAVIEASQARKIQDALDALRAAT